jgi:hypothetical protein
MHRISGVVAVAAFVIWSAGCGGSEGHKAPPTAKVSGTVKLDGKPMPSGEVRFEIVGETVKAMEVKDGAFSGDAFVGKNRVDVVLEKDGPANPMNPSAKIKVNVVSDRFSGLKSTLSAQVNSGENAPFSFEVTSKR